MIELTDDGTLDTVLRCTECGEEFRFMYDGATDTADEDAAVAAYDAFVDECVADATDEHECGVDT